MIDFDALVVGPAVDTFGGPITYTPFVPTLDANGSPLTDDNGDPIGTLGTPYSTGVDGKPLVGVFDAQFQEVTTLGKGPWDSADAIEFGAPGGITEARPVIGVQLSAMQTYPAQYDEVTIGTTVYEVKEVQPDSHGWALLTLNLK